MLRSTPIYESLLAIQVGEGVSERHDTDQYKKITFESIVHHGCRFEGKTIRDMSLPYGSLVVAIRRHGGDITPNGETVIHAEDTLVVLTSLKDEVRVKEILKDCTEAE